MKKGTKMTAESRAKISASQIGKKQSVESNIKRSIAHMGRKKSQEAIKNISAAKMGDKNPAWKGGKTIRQGYVYIKVYGHPNAIQNYIKEHRYVMEQHIGRFLDKNEVVHHINGIKTDNRIENLVLCKSASEHMSEHHQFINKNNSFTHRQCFKCKRILLLDCFYINKSYKFNRSYKCKDCKKEE